MNFDFEISRVDCVVIMGMWTHAQVDKHMHDSVVKHKLFSVKRKLFSVVKRKLFFTLANVH